MSSYTKPLIIGAVVILCVSVFTYYRHQVLADRQAYIHDRGSMVMPFDLTKTTHTFTPTDTGGVQEIHANDPNDAQQIGLIQTHLRQESEAFARGDFTDPATLHGADMHGLATLEASANKYTVQYEDLADGARITYNTTDQAVLNAFHQWFMAQLHDHGSDAMEG